MMETAQRPCRIRASNCRKQEFWKPRTRPGMFEGIGKEGLEWLVNAGKQSVSPLR